MNLSVAEEESAQEIHLPAEIDWQMLDKSKFFFLGAALFSGVSASLYPAVVLKTRQQVAQSQISCMKTAFSMVRHEGFRALYRGFGTSLTGTIPARALYMTALEVTKSNVGTATVRLGLSEATAATLANAAAGLSAAMAAQLVWTPVDVVSQRLMVQGCRNSKLPNASACKYLNGVDAFRKILRTDGPRGLYRGFGISILTYAPSNAVWWASYSIAQRLVWGGVGCYNTKKAKTLSLSARGLSGAHCTEVKKDFHPFLIRRRESLCCVCLSLKMEISRVLFFVLGVASLFLTITAQSSAPAPAPTSDGATIDQGIACLLMLVALVLTYLIH